MHPNEHQNMIKILTKNIENITYFYLKCYEKYHKDTSVMSKNRAFKKSEKMKKKHENRMVKIAKTLREYAKNLVEICVKSAKIVENRAKVAKSSKNHRQISKDTSTTLQNVIRNGKIRKNRKGTSTTLQKACIFRKILYQSPGKLLEIVNFYEKS